MSDLNQCTFVGRLGQDPEVTVTPTGRKKGVIMLNKMQIQTLRTLVERASSERLHALVQSNKVPAQDAEYQFYQELLGELKAQAKLDDGWISVDDAQPPNGGDFWLVYTDKGRIAECRYYSDEWITTYCNNERVTHWQPLPSPPKER